ncbi:MAG: tRNA (guanosine(46)-N7)-methyltransferase TrmB [Clostridia bacterium]|nr:tRNA (guanosine(46)-N7)-methyltransferase TrmB [Clostridia bacterium]MBR2296847.1 tRNA (guanosine(46)-N7)-methyltransferase TrmB [Clostridia bacterium]
MRMKKKRHGSERLSLLSSLIVENPATLVENLESVYGNNKPLRIEIGCGKGDFVRGKSVQESDYNYLAIEKIADVCVLATEKYATSRSLGNLAPNGGWQTPDGTIYPLGADSVPMTLEEMGNVRFAVGDASELLKDLPDNSVDAIYVNFCDPWGKKGHAKRRLTHINFLNMYSRILVKGGKFHFKTDNRDLFDFSLEEVEKSPFLLEYKTYDLHASDMNDVNIQTEYERNFTEKGFKINMLIAKNEK